VSIKPVPGAKQYQVGMSGYEDGSGVQAVAKASNAEPVLTDLRPEYPLSIFATCTDADGRTSKPFVSRRIALKDEPPMKSQPLLGSPCLLEPAQGGLFVRRSPPTRLWLPWGA